MFASLVIASIPSLQKKLKYLLMNFILILGIYHIYNNICVFAADIRRDSLIMFDVCKVSTKESGAFLLGDGLKSKVFLPEAATYFLETMANLHRSCHDPFRCVYYRHTNTHFSFSYPSCKFVSKIQNPTFFWFRV